MDIASAYKKLHAWSAYLKSSEIVLLHWLAAETVLKGGRSVKVSLADMVDPERNESRPTCPLCLPTLCSNMQKLRRRGLVEVLSGGAGRSAFEYAINWDWAPKADVLSSRAVTTDGRADRRVRAA